MSFNAENTTAFSSNDLQFLTIALRFRKSPRNNSKCKFCLTVRADNPKAVECFLAEYYGDWKKDYLTSSTFLVVSILLDGLERGVSIVEPFQDWTPISDGVVQSLGINRNLRWAQTGASPSSKNIFTTSACCVMKTAGSGLNHETKDIHLLLT